MVHEPRSPPDEVASALAPRGAPSTSPSPPTAPGRQRALREVKARDLRDEALVSYLEALRTDDRGQVAAEAWDVRRRGLRATPPYRTPSERMRATTASPTFRPSVSPASMSKR